MILLDVRHLGVERVIASYLVETDDGLALFDCGPTSTLENLRAALTAAGVAVGDLRHLLLSHIHLDHAGAAGPLVRENPSLRVHVSAVGAPHLVDPSRLERSARRLYGEHFDRLWGELAPVPETNIEIAGDRVVGLDCFPTVGHASHHISYLSADGTLLAGDAAGVRIVPSAYVMPPTPPPDIDVEGWYATIDEIERRGPARLALIHFGVVDDVGRHLGDLRERLGLWAERVRSGMDEEEFTEAAFGELSQDDRELFAHAIPPWQSYLGLKRYWEKR